MTGAFCTTCAPHEKRYNGKGWLQGSTKRATGQLESSNKEGSFLTIHQE